VASERLALTASGQVRYTLKTAYRDGTTHIVLEPLDRMARLAALVPTPRHVAMSRARRLKRVFGVEIESCTRCGGQLKIIASIEEPQLIAKILSHLERAAPEQYQSEAKGGVGAMRAARLAGWVARQRPKALRRGLLAAKFSRPATRLLRATRLLSLDATQGWLRATRLWAALDRTGV